MNMISPVPDAETLCRQATAFLDTGRPGAARPLLAAARTLDDTIPTLVLAEVRLALLDGALIQAIEQLDRALITNPSHAGLRKCRADVRYGIGDWEGAARDAAEAVVAQPSDADAKARLGTALLELGYIKEAIACMQEALAAAPNLVGCREALARALEAAGDIEAADRVLTDGLAPGPANVTLFNAAIMLNLRRRDFVQAVAQAEQAVLAGIADATTFALKGHASCSLGQHDQAVQAYQEALKLAPEDQHIRHLAAAHGMTSEGRRAPADYVRHAFDAYAGRFDAHLASLGYAIPSLIADVVARHPKIAGGNALGPVLDLGCGTGLVAMALGDLPLGPFTGIDLSPNMLAEAERKRLYATLREADIIEDLSTQSSQWPLIVAADVVCYFGDLKGLMHGISRCLAPEGWFVFSIETLLPDRDGVLPGNGDWALLRQGRYAHTHDYVYDCISEADLRIAQNDRCVIRREAGADVPGLLLTITPVAA